MCIPPEPDLSPDLVPLPLNGVIDLHTFRPSEVGSLIPEFIEASQAQGFLSLRIIHGKGSGTLRTTVHAILQRHPLVSSFSLAPAEAGGWGATLVHLHPPPNPPQP